MVSASPHFEAAFVVRKGDPEELKGSSATLAIEQLADLKFLLAGWTLGVGG